MMILVAGDHRRVSRTQGLTPAVEVDDRLALEEDEDLFTFVDVARLMRMGNAAGCLQDDSASIDEGCGYNGYESFEDM